jgi:hypothetical protein
MAVLTIDPCGLNAESWRQAEVGRVLLQVLHELITCHQRPNSRGMR